MYSREKIMEVLYEIAEGSLHVGPYLIVAQPRRNREETAAQSFQGYGNTHIDLLGFSHGYIDIAGEKVDVARNYLIERCIESTAKYLLFIGEDTVLPWNAFKVLHRTAEDNPGSVVTGVYYMKGSDAMIMVLENNSISVPDVSPGQLIEAWQTGMDCMLIPLDLLRKMKELEPEVPFCCVANDIKAPTGVLPFVGEDNFFVYRLHKHNIKLLVNTDVQCLHMDLATGLYTAHPSVNLDNYFTNIKPTRPITLADKKYIDARWIDRVPEGTGTKISFLERLSEMVKNNEAIKFNMGCGHDKKEGYIGVDKHSSTAELQEDVLDVELPSDCADEIFASHLIEHIPQHRTLEILQRWFITLKPNGKLVLETPNVAELFEDYLKEDSDKFKALACIYGAYVEEDSPETRKRGALSPHIWGFTPKSLSEACARVGFRDIQILPPEGKHPGFNFRLEALK